MSTCEQNLTDSAASTPGAILKRCREYHGISLDEAAEATKIGKNYLRSLEDDQTKDFANLAYLKGFLRIYATYLGLNADDMMRLYDKQTNPQGSRRQEAGTDESTGRPRWRLSLQKLLLPAVLLVLMVVTAGIINHSRQQPQSSAPPPATSAAPHVSATVQQRQSSSRAAATEKKPEKPDDQEVKREAPVSEKPAPPPARMPEPSKGLIVRLKVVQNGTLTVTIDGGTPQNYDLTIGDVIEWKAEKRVVLDVSNAGGVEAEVNGRAVKPFGAAGKPASVVLDAENTQ